MNYNTTRVSTLNESLQIRHCIKSKHIKHRLQLDLNSDEAEITKDGTKFY